VIVLHQVLPQLEKSCLCCNCTFCYRRPFEMFKNDLGYMNQNVKVVGRCAGLTYDQLGSTHHSIDDVALIRTIPGVMILSPGDL